MHPGLSSLVVDSQINLYHVFPNMSTSVLKLPPGSASELPIETNFESEIQRLLIVHIAASTMHTISYLSRK